jgi:hypothetical protein
MDRLKRGFIFMIEAGRIARWAPNTLQPLAYYLGAGLAVAILISVLIALCLARLGAAGAGLAGFLAVLLLGMLLVAGYLASVEAGRRVYLILKPDQAEGTAPAWQTLRRRWLDLAAIAIATPLIAPLRVLITPQPSVEFLTAPWTQAAGLVSSGMAIEGLDLKQSLQRVSQMVCDNLLLMQPGQVAAGWAAALAGLLLSAGGILLGWGIGRGVALSTFGLPHRSAAGLAAGLVIASACILLAVAESAYTAAAYRTCLFAWARDVETNRRCDDPTALEPPAPLTRTLAGLESLTAPVYPGSNQTSEG